VQYRPVALALVACRFTRERGIGSLLGLPFQGGSQPRTLCDELRDNHGDGGRTPRTLRNACHAERAFERGAQSG
jgi:hypothetical protein